MGSGPGTAGVHRGPGPPQHRIFRGGELVPDRLYPLPVFGRGQGQRVAGALDMDPFPAPSRAGDAAGQLACLGQGRPCGAKIAQGGKRAGDTRPAVDFPGQFASGSGLRRRFLEHRQRGPQLTEQIQQDRRILGRLGGHAVPPLVDGRDRVAGKVDAARDWLG